MQLLAQLGRSLLDLLLHLGSEHDLLGGDLGVDTLCLSHALTYFPRLLYGGLTLYTPVLRDGGLCCPLPTKRGINRAQQRRHSAPAALVVKARATEGLPQADPRRLLGAKLVDHLSSGFLHLLHALPPYPGGGEAISSPQLVVVGRGLCLVLGREVAPPMFVTTDTNSRGRPAHDPYALFCIIFY